MTDKLKKPLKITGLVLGGLVALILVFYAVLWIIRAAKYGDSMKIREYVCDIPDINNGFVPQGISYSEEKGTYVMSGYDGKSGTMFYVVKDNEAKRVMVADKDGNDLKGHGGGVTVAKDYVYIANDSCLTTYSLDALIAAGGTDTRVKPIAVKPVDNSASFCFSDSTNLYVGEFYREQNYKTDEKHHKTAPDGSKHYAIVSCYALTPSGAILGDIPLYAYSITDLVQGFAVKGDTIVLSRSYGLADSKLEYYKRPLLPSDVVEVSFKHAKELGTRTIPLLYLDSSDLVKTTILSPFSEDLAIVNDRIVVTSEAACNKYFIGKLFGATKVWSYPLD